MKKIYKKEKQNLFGLRPNNLDWQYQMNLSGNFIVQPSERNQFNQRKYK